MKHEEFNSEIQAHRDRVAKTMSVEVCMDRIEFIANSPAEMLAFEQTLLALALVASSMGSEKTKNAILEVGCLVSCIAVQPKETLDKLRAMP